MDFEIIVPAGAFGKMDNEPFLDSMLREIAVTFSKNAKMEWAEKYGTDFENDIFMMHRYCWCEQDGCPWCVGCDCPESAWHYLVDGKEVSSDEWLNSYTRIAYTEPTNGLANSFQEWVALPDDIRRKLYPAINRGSKEAQKRRDVVHDRECAFCRGELQFVLDKGGGAGQQAPHFWYKPTNFKVEWYKYIGRDMKANRQIDLPELQEIRQAVLVSKL